MSQKRQQYDTKKGIAFGAFAGFIAAVAFAGIIMELAPLLRMPTGIFLDALGLLVVPNTVQDPALIGVAAFAIILIQGIIIGIIFGIVTARVQRLHPSGKRKGVAMGLITGFIGFLIIYIPMNVTGAFPALLSQASVTYPEEKLAMFGLSDYNLTVGQAAYMQAALGLGVIAYLVYGFIMGGIVTLEYSVYYFIASREREEEGAAAKSPQAPR